jgi:Lrp/AsnC family transcriptional regulator
MLDDTDRRLLRHLLAEPALPTAGAGRTGRCDRGDRWRRIERLKGAG